MSAFTSWLREAREGQGLSMREMASRLGRPHSFVQKVETGERRLDVVEYVWYCRALGALPQDGIDVVIDAADRPMRRLKKAEPRHV